MRGRNEKGLVEEKKKKDEQKGKTLRQKKWQVNK